MVPKFIRMGVLKVQCFQNNGVRGGGGSANLGYLYRCRVSAFLHVCQFEPRLFLKSHFKTFDQIEPAIFLLSKSQTQPPIKILYLFCYYTFIISLKNPIPCQSFFNPPLWDPLHNIHQPNKDRIRLLSQLTWKEKTQTSFHQFITLPFLNCNSPVPVLSSSSKSWTGVIR